MYRVSPTGGPYAPKTEQKFILRRPMLISRGAVDFDAALAFAQTFSQRVKRSGKSNALAGEKSAEMRFEGSFESEPRH